MPRLWEVNADRKCMLKEEFAVAFLLIVLALGLLYITVYAGQSMRSTYQDFRIDGESRRSALFLTFLFYLPFHWPF